MTGQPHPQDKPTPPAQKLHVFINLQRVELDTDQMTGQQLLQKAGFTSNFDLFLLHGEGDPSGGTKLQLNQLLALKNGQHYHAVPSNPTFGA